MEKLRLKYKAGAPANGRTLVGVVGSGDLEVLAEPGPAGSTVVDVCTSVDGSGPLWRAQLARLFADPTLPALKLEINDFGATPGVVQMRVAQVLEEIGHE